MSNKGKMAISAIFKVILLTVMTIGGHTAAQDGTGTFLSQARKIIPDIDQRINSPEIEDRISVLDQLVVRVDEMCYITYKFPYDLPTDDYYHLVVAVLEGELYRVKDTEKVRKVLEKIVHTAIKLKLKNITQYFLPFLKYDDNIVQMQALRVLEQLEAKQYTKEIAKLLSIPDRDVSEQAFKVLVKFNAKEAVPGLITLLKHEKAIRRYYALEALGKIGDKSAIPYVVSLLQDPHKNNCYWAVDTLVSLDANEAVPDIWQAYRNGLVGKSTIAALVYFGEVEAIPLAMDYITDKELSRRDGMIDRLVRLQARAVIPALISALEDDKIYGDDIGTNSNIRRDIIMCLAKLDAHDAVPVLRQYVKTKSRFLSEAAVDVLGILRAKEAVPDLLPLLEQDIRHGDSRFFVSRVALALARIGQRETIPALLKFARNPKCNRPEYIIVALNASLDSQLWNTIQSTTVQGLYIKPVNSTLFAFSEESSIPLVLHYQPQNRESPSTDFESPWPKVNTSVDRISLFSALMDVSEAMGSAGRPFTFILQNDEVRIMPLDEAIAWWESFLQIKHVAE